MEATGYTGPTGGRIRVGPDGEVSSERFHDPVLTRAEADAVAWFTALSPHEQLRTVRRLAWNESVFRKEVDAWKKVSRKQDAEIQKLRRKLAAFTPEGFALPASAESLLRFAGEHGWATERIWQTYKEGEENGALLEIALRNGLWAFKLTWSCDPGGAGRMTRSGLARGPRRDWHDAPSLVKVREIIRDNPGPQAGDL